MLGLKQPKRLPVIILLLLEKLATFLVIALLAARLDEFRDVHALLVKPKQVYHHRSASALAAETLAVLGATPITLLGNVVYLNLPAWMPRAFSSNDLKHLNSASKISQVRGRAIVMWVALLAGVVVPQILAASLGTILAVVLDPHLTERAVPAQRIRIDVVWHLLLTFLHSVDLLDFSSADAAAGEVEALRIDLNDLTVYS